MKKNPPNQPNQQTQPYPPGSGIFLRHAPQWRYQRKGQQSRTNDTPLTLAVWSIHFTKNHRKFVAVSFSINCCATSPKGIYLQVASNVATYIGKHPNRKGSLSLCVFRTGLKQMTFIVAPSPVKLLGARNSTLL